MAEHFTGEVRNGVVVFDPDVAPPGEGARVRVEVVEAPRPEPNEGDPLASTRAWLLAAAEEAEANAPPLPSDLAENHDHYAHGRPRP